MKKVINVFLIVIACFVFGSAQVMKPDKTQSQIEQFSSRAGRLIQKEFIDFGKVNRVVTVQLFIVTDLIDNSAQKGVRFSYDAYSSIGSDTKIAVLDADEVDGLIKSINALRNNVFHSTRTSYTEVIFQSRDGFEAGAYSSGGKWTAFLQLEKYDRNSMIAMKPEDFDNLLAILEDAKTKMK